MAERTHERVLGGFTGRGLAQVVPGVRQPAEGLEARGVQKQSLVIRVDRLLVGEGPVALVRPRDRGRVLRSTFAWDIVRTGRPSRSAGLGSALQGKERREHVARVSLLIPERQSEG